MSDIVELAERMTEAQRLELLRCPTGSLVVHILELDTYRGRDFRRLRSHGLVGGVGDDTRLTPLGFAMRDYLRTMP